MKKIAILTGPGLPKSNYYLSAEIWCDNVNKQIIIKYKIFDRIPLIGVSGKQESQAIASNEFVWLEGTATYKMALRLILIELSNGLARIAASKIMDDLGWPEMYFSVGFIKVNNHN